MADPNERLRIVDSLEPPDLWSEAVRRGNDPAVEAHVTRQEAAWRRPVIVLVAFAVFAGAAAFAWSAFNPLRDAISPSPGPVAADPFDIGGVPEGWTRLPYAPPQVRSTAATAWTGEELLVWGGYVYTGFSDETTTNDGFRFDFATGAMSPLAPSSLEPRQDPASAWTGEELLIWGGWTDASYRGEGSAGGLGDGAAYDPESDTWRMLPAAPISPRAPLSAWTGSELIVWGTSVRETTRPLDGAAYDPTSNSWRTIALGPIELTDARAVWTGGEMIVFGAALHGGNLPETPTAIGAAYDPVSDTWRELPPSEMSPNSNDVVWTGEELVVWDYGSRAQVFDMASWSWRHLPDVPIDGGEDYPHGIGAGGEMFGEFWGQQVVLADGVWHNVTRPELGYDVWGSFFVDGVVVSYGYPLNDYGPDSPVLAYAYRAPTSFACGGLGDVSAEDLASALAWRLGILRGQSFASVRNQLDQILSTRALADLADASTGPSFGASWPQRVSVSAQPDGSFQAILEVDVFAGGRGLIAERLLIRPGTNVAREDCGLVIDEVTPIEVESVFVPASEQVGDRTVTTLAFPDGSNITISFPAHLQLLQPGIQPHVSYLWRDDPPPRFPISFIHGPREAALDRVGEATSEVFPTAGGGTAELAGGLDGTVLWWLIYELPDWTVLVPVDRVGDAETVASAIGVAQDEHGFPVVTATGPVALSEESGEGGGSELWIFDVTDMLELSLAPCTPEGDSIEGGYGSKCLVDGRVALGVQGARHFVRDVIEGVRVESFEAAT